MMKGMFLPRRLQMKRCEDILLCKCCIVTSLGTFLFTNTINKGMSSCSP
jgi:hypothetical protein